MYRIDGGDAAVALPTPGAAGTGGYFEGGTVVSADWLNLVQEEIVAVVALDGTALSKSTTNQMAAVVEPVLALDSDASDTGSVTSDHVRLVAVSASSRASGSRATAIAASAALCAGTQAAVIASTGAGTLTGVQAGGTDCAIMATNAADIDSGTQCAIIATDGGSVESSSNAAAIIASTDLGANALETSGADSAAVIACFNTAADVSVTGTGCAIIACDGGTAAGTNSALIACEESSISGANPNAAMGSTGCEVEGTNSVLLGSINARLSTNFAVGLGYSGSALAGTGDENITILLDAQNGDITAGGTVDCEALDVNNGVALGGGATPTLGTIGGSGPTLAAQSKWLQVAINGTNHWIPVWV